MSKANVLGFEVLKQPSVKNSLSVTNLTGDGTAGAGTVGTSVSLTAEAGTWLILSVHAYVSAGSVQPTSPTIAGTLGSTLTWSLLATLGIDTTGGDRSSLFVFAAYVPSPGAGTISITFGASMTRIVWIVDKINGARSSSTLAVQTVSSSVVTASPASVSLAAFNSPKNLSYGITALMSDTAATFTPGSGYSTVGSINKTGGGFAVNLATEAELADNDPSESWTTTTTFQAGIVGIEVQGNMIPSGHPSPALIPSPTAAYTEAATPTSITSLSATEAHVITDSGTVSGTTSISKVETAQYVESNTPSSSSSVTSAETAALIDANTPKTTSSVQSQDIAAFVDGSVTVAGQSSVISSDVLALIDANTPHGATSVSAIEVATFVDSDTPVGSTEINSAEFVAVDDSGTISSETTVTSSDVAVYGDANTANGITKVLYVEEYQITDAGIVASTTTITYEEVKPVFDAATVSSTTTIPVAYEYGPELAFALVGSIRRRWSANTCIERLTGEARIRWTATWRG